MWVQRRENTNKPDELLACNLGLVLPQARIPGGICVAETFKRFDENKLSTIHFAVRSLETLSPGRSTPDVAKRLSEIVRKIRILGRLPRLLVDVTGRGEPPVKFLRSAVSGVGWIKPVVFNYGADFIEEGSGDKVKIRCGKGLLVSLVKILLEAGTLHLTRSPEARQLANDLRDFEVRTDQVDSRLDGSFKVGQRDELVSALGLSLLDEGLPGWKWSELPGYS